ncbi:MAG: DUF4837 family protein [Prevotellaceae bacterium]|jgi:hypothetical protein|nr:DUF4837 family protein [Prevotellaceae bacterium]
MKPVFYTLLLLLSSLYVTSCKDGARGKTLLPGVTGASGEIVVVADKHVGESPFMKSLVEKLSEEYPMLPQVEPMFSVHVIPPTAFSDLFKRHRNLIIAQVSPEAEQSKIFVRQDVWASPQTVLYIQGNKLDSLAAYIPKYYNRVTTTFEQAEVQRNIANIKRYEQVSIREEVKGRFGFSLYFPFGYTLRRTPGENFMWISNETETTSHGIFIYAYPNVGKVVPGKKNILAERTLVLTTNVPGPTLGSYMIASPEIEPVESTTRFAGQPCRMLRGLWELKSDFMGGPFISYTVVDPSGQRAITLEGYVYAPQKDKRILLRQVDAVLQTLSFD